MRSGEQQADGDQGAIEQVGAVGERAQDPEQEQSDPPE
jgi:hypothetical protein